MKKMSLLKKTINPVTVIFWVIAIVIMAVVGFVLKRKKAT